MKSILTLFVLFNVICSFSQGVKPKCIDGNCRNKIGTYLYEDSSIYSGEFTDRMRNGQGKIVYKDGSFYEGTWLIEKRNGSGTFVDDKGNKYIGEWLNDKRNGNGIYVTSAGNIYEGNWSNDKQNGLGKQTDEKGNIYTGSWNEGILNGNVKIQFKNNDVYEGEYINGFNGKGKLTYSNGSVYNGNWNNNMRFGYGEMIYPFGITYKGNWNSNEVIGIGEFYESSTQKVLASGNWKTEKSKNGDLKFINSKGYMISYTVSKDLFTGYTKNGVYNGSGKIVYSNGNCYEGVFSNGEYYGNGHFYYSDKSEYTGEWKDNLKDGYGVFINKDKSIIKGYWVADKYVGADKPKFENLGQIDCDINPRYFLYNKYFLVEYVRQSNKPYKKPCVLDKKFNKINDIDYWEVIDKAEAKITPEGIEINDTKKGNHFIIYDNTGKKNLLLENFSSSTKFIYDEIYEIPNSNYFLTFIKSKDGNESNKTEIYGFINNQGKEVPKDSVELLKFKLLGKGNEGLFIFKQGNKCGFIDSTCKIIIGAKYDEVEVFSDGLAVVYNGNKYGYINKKGEVVIPLNIEFDTLEHFSGGDQDRSFKNGYAKILKNGKYGIIKKNGVKLFNETFDNIFILNKKNKQGLQLFAVMKKLNTQESTFYTNDALYGIINEKGIQEVDFKFQGLREYNDVILTFGIVRNKIQKQGIINQFGKELFSPIFYHDSYSDYGYQQENANLFNEDSLLIVSIDRKFGLINLSGKYILPCNYDEIHESNGNLRDYCDQIPINSYEYKTQGKSINYLIYYIISIDNKYGLANKKGEIVIPIIYDQWSNGYDCLNFKLKNMIVLVNRFGKEFFRCIDCKLVQEPKFVSVILNDNKKGYEFDKLVFTDGREISLTSYKKIYHHMICDFDYIIVKSENDKLGAIDFNGNVVLEIKYDNIEIQESKLFKLQIDGKCELIKFN